MICVVHLAGIIMLYVCRSLHAEPYTQSPPDGRRASNPCPFEPIDYLGEKISLWQAARTAASCGSRPRRFVSAHIVGYLSGQVSVTMATIYTTPPLIPRTHAMVASKWTTTDAHMHDQC
ncbi:hypothetical protein FB45DRAFT_51338 [Roridomyces roridus]|uniref:Secreted protein n=1 Tax=Roridomyces roridus TaxID=1738132 RepID=A0AAD7F6A3_9AGAR|nr:hypothetical protein FB45DRAFT_51338 [Roridomyces roridus]